MTFYTLLPKSLKPYFNQELSRYHAQHKAGNLAQAWNHLERAHILGQKYPFAHSQVHWNMLLFGIAIKSKKEVVGQIPRLLVGGIKSFVGIVPLGNPGGANVPALEPFPIPEDLQEIFRKAGVALN